MTEGTKFNLPEDLYPYQLEDADKMLNGHNWLNFSEMGVGKTPEAIQVIEKGGYGVPLIVCPNSLRLEWARQIEEWTGPGHTAVSHPDSYQKLGPIVYSFKFGQKYRIVNYETFRSKQHLEILNQMPCDIIVFDEIHKVRNPKTKQVKGVWEFLEEHPGVKILGLSGSPIMNYPNDLYVPLSIIDDEEYPRTMQRWRMFMYQYCFWSDGQYGPYIYGSRNMQQLRERTAPLIIRRTKKEVLPFLPEKYYRRSLIDMKKDQRDLYNKMETELQVLLDTGEPLWSTNVLSCLTRLRQINLDPKILGITCSSTKSEYILDIIESTDEKIVVFSTFEKYIEYLKGMLDIRKIKNIVVTGMVPPDRRSERVKQFQEDDSIQVFLATIQTAGEGLTLTSASNVLFADRWWNQPVNQQGEDRLHRIGQRSPVQVLLPIVQNSVDETLDTILERKYLASQEYYQEKDIRQTVIQERGLNLK